MTIRWIAALAGALLALGSAAAQTAPQPAAAPVEASEPLKARIAELPGLLGGTVAYDSYFTPGFRAKVTKPQFDQVTAQLTGAYGPVAGVQDVTPKSPWSATLSIVFRDAIGAASISVDPADPHQVDGLLISGITARAPTAEAVVAELQKLHGTTGFAIARLGTGKPQLTTSLYPDAPLGVGSAFKLVILAELIRETNAGTRKWSDMVTLDGTPLPGGAYTASPKGTQVSIRDLAAKMISVSDNSATDILLKTLGRAKVEAMLPVLGVADPARDRPYMSTLEMFKLKGVAGLADRYLAKNEAGRRAMLGGEIAGLPNSTITPGLFKDGKPVLIDRLEWYFTPNDIVRIYDWIRHNSEGGAGAEARKILAINGALPPASATAWAYVGYKGGSEPGVINLSWLLQGKDGNWYVVTGSWNDPVNAVDLTKFFGLLSRAVDLTAPK